MIYHIKIPTVNDYEVKKNISYQGTSVNKKKKSKFKLIYTKYRMYLTIYLFVHNPVI